MYWSLNTQVFRAVLLFKCSIFITRIFTFLSVHFQVIFLCTAENSCICLSKSSLNFQSLGSFCSYSKRCLFFFHSSNLHASLKDGRWETLPESLNFFDKYSASCSSVSVYNNERTLLHFTLHCMFPIHAMVF